MLALILFRTPCQQLVYRDTCRQRRKLATMFKIPNQQIHFCLHGNEYLIVWGAHFHMGTYNHNVAVVTKMGAYIH